MKKFIFIAICVLSSSAFAWDSRNNLPLVTGIVIGSQFAPPIVIAPLPSGRPYAPPPVYYNYAGREYYQQRRGRTPVYREVREYDSFCECVVTRVEFVGLK